MRAQLRHSPVRLGFSLSLLLACAGGAMAQDDQPTEDEQPDEEPDDQPDDKPDDQPDDDGPPQE